MDFQETLTKLRELQEPQLTNVTLAPGVVVKVGPPSMLDWIRIHSEEDTDKRIVLMIVSGAKFDHKISEQEALELIDLIPGKEAMRVFEELTKAMRMDDEFEVQSKQAFLEPTHSSESSSVKRRNGANGRTKSATSRQIAPATP